MIIAMMQAARNYVRAKMIADATLSQSFTELSLLPGDPPDITTLPEGLTLYEVRGVIEETPPPEERHTIYVKVREVKGDIAFLKDWIIEVSVGGFTDVEGFTLANHSALELAVDRIWDKNLPANANAQAELATRVAAKVPGWNLAGFHAQGWEEVRDGNELLPGYEVKAGIIKSDL